MAAQAITIANIEAAAVLMIKDQNIIGAWFSELAGTYASINPYIPPRPSHQEVV